MKTIKIMTVSLLVLILMIMLCVVAFADKGEPCLENLYPMTAVVFDLDRENDIVICETCSGMLWEFEGCEDWDIDDIVSLLMYDNETPLVYDDEIIMVRYGGYFG